MSLLNYVLLILLQQNSDTVLADMVNNLMSGLLGQPTTTSAAASSASSTGASTMTTATSTATAQPQPGAGHIGQPGMPRASIRIQPPAALQGFFPGRMAHIPGM